MPSIQPATAALVAAVLATLGWLYTNRRNRVLSRKQHTINVMLQASLNKDYRDALAQISHARETGICPNLADGNNHVLKDSFRLVANHMEFIAAGLRNGDFDEQLVRDSQKGQFVQLFTFFEPFIGSLRTTRQRMAIYEHLQWLVDRWTIHRPGFFQSALEWCLHRPLQGRRVKA